jgi:two-component system, chemotaxis family, CheB/CheR fusion protein
MKKAASISYQIQETEKQIPFPVTGIGSSVGKLDAFELFLKHVPCPCGMTFVLIQHLDPAQKGVMVELLQRHFLK